MLWKAVTQKGKITEDSGLKSDTEGKGVKYEEVLQIA